MDAPTPPTAELVIAATDSGSDGLQVVLARAALALSILLLLVAVGRELTR